jgi:arylsulfatase A-like enzyme
MVETSPAAAWANEVMWYGCITQLDAALGELLTFLRADAARWRETFLLFASDNGPEARTSDPQLRSCFGSARPFRGMKESLYEGGIRVPCLLKWGGGGGGGATSVPVHAFDLLPTLSALIGVRLAAVSPADGGPSTHGVDLAPLAAGAPTLNRSWPLFWTRHHVPGRAAPVADHACSVLAPRPTYALRSGRWKVLGTTEPYSCAGNVRTPDNHVYVCLRDTLCSSRQVSMLEQIRRAPLAALELYDLDADPAEAHDLAAARPRVLRRLRAALADARAHAQGLGSDYDLDCILPLTSSLDGQLRPACLCPVERMRRTRHTFADSNEYRKILHAGSANERRVDPQNGTRASHHHHSCHRHSSLRRSLRTMRCCPHHPLGAAVPRSQR